MSFNQGKSYQTLTHRQALKQVGNAQVTGRANAMEGCSLQVSWEVSYWPHLWAQSTRQVITGFQAHKLGFKRPSQQTINCNPERDKVR